MDERSEAGVSGARDKLRTSDSATLTPSPVCPLFCRGVFAKEDEFQGSAITYSVHSRSVSNFLCRQKNATTFK